ncbi:MAG: histidine phosphatase family protein [Ornithinibacter sp.]
MSEPDRTVVHLMRHGEVHNPEGVLYGRLPGYRLSALGLEMAETVARHLIDHDVSLVVASSLERAQQTAGPIARGHEVPVLTDDRVIEAGNHFEGLTFGRGAGSLRRLQNLRRLWNPLRPSWGEPYARIASRMFAAIEDARDHARGHEAVLVSHQLPIWTMRCRLEGRRLWHDPRQRECSLASLTSLTFEGEELETVSYSEPAAALLARAHQSVGA